MPTPTQWRQRPAAVNTLQAGKGLCRQLAIASSPGWERGFTDTNLQGAIRPPVSGQNGAGGTSAVAGRGLWETVADATNYPSPFEDFGRQINSGDLVTPSMRFGNYPGFPPVISYETTFGWSIAVLFRPNTLQSADQVIINRRATPYGAAQAGWSLHCQAGNTYQARISDGVSQVTVTSSATQNTANADLIVATFDGTLMKIFVNGALSGLTATAPFTIGNVNRSIRLGGTGFASGSYGMFAMWTRALTTGEITRLYSDPFVFWRDDYPNELDVDISPVWNTFFAAF